MEQGYLLERDRGQNAATVWVEGAVDKKWYGIKTGDKLKLAVETWRCGRCGYLESFAPA